VFVASSQFFLGSDLKNHHTSYHHLNPTTPAIFIMSAACRNVPSLNQTNSAYNNLCILGGPPAVLSSSIVANGWKGCCTDNLSTFERSTDNCYLECHITNATVFQTFRDCFCNYNFGMSEGFGAKCFGDISTSFPNSKYLLFQEKVSRSPGS
jgi:hypothetical protein